MLTHLFKQRKLRKNMDVNEEIVKILLEMLIKEGFKELLKITPDDIKKLAKELDKKMLNEMYQQEKDIQRKTKSDEMAISKQANLIQ